MPISSKPLKMFTVAVFEFKPVYLKHKHVKQFMSMIVHTVRDF